jgi:phosphoglycerate dehydrogenase-like enzyme
MLMTNLLRLSQENSTAGGLPKASLALLKGKKGLAEDKLNILFLNKFNDYWKIKFEALKKEFPQVHFVTSYDPAERDAVLAEADAVCAGRITEKEIENSPKVKAIIVPFTGLNNFPAEIISRRQIKMYNTHANAKYVAEHAVALAMALLHRVAEFHNDLKKGFWNRSIEGEDMWVTLQSMKAAIIGYGHIGRSIAKMLKAFDCRITGFVKNTDGEKGFADELTTDLQQAIEANEIIFVCLPLNDGTKNLLSKDILMKMHGKYLVNVGRGDTVNEEGLYESLKNNVLAGAALDVWYNYPGKNPEPVFPANLPIYDLPNVLLSPHKSSHTTAAINAMVDDTFENIRNFIMDNL